MTFTFHNVSISTNPRGRYHAHGWTLHSTMYLFLLHFNRQKTVLSDFLYIPQCIYFYTRTQRKPYRPQQTLHSTMYLFLLWSVKAEGIRCVLYIPQCIYFYRPPYPLRWYENPLYIPQCIYFYPSNLLTLKYSDYIPCFVDFLPYINSITNLYL